MGTKTTRNTRLAEIVDDEGRRQDWIAGRVGVHPGTFNRWFHGLHVPEHHRAAIANALGREIGELFAEDGSHLPPAGVPA